MVAFKKKKILPPSSPRQNTKITKNATNTRVILGDLSASLVLLVVDIYLFECDAV